MGTYNPYGTCVLGRYLDSNRGTARLVGTAKGRTGIELKGGSVKKTTASELTLITGIGRVPLTRTQVASWQRRTTAESRPGDRSFTR